MKKIALALFILLANLTNAQNSTPERTLQIIGSAKVSVTPDIGVLNIHVSEIDTSFNKSILRLGDKTNYYIKLLVSLGFKEEEIKTTSFTVSKNRFYRKDQYVDSGYVASQDVKIEFINDKKILSKILNKFSTSESNADFSFSFKLSEKLKSEVQSKIIELAIKDAKEKADLITKNALVKLKMISSINYGWSESSGMQQIDHEYLYHGAGGASMDVKVFNFTPDDLVFHDSIIFDWIIE